MSTSSSSLTLSPSAFATLKSVESVGSGLEVFR